MRKKALLLFFAFFSGMVLSAGNALGQEEDLRNNSQEGDVEFISFAHIGVYGPEIIDQDGNNILVEFIIVNEDDFVQPQVRYSLQLIQKNGGQAMIIANVNHVGTQQLNYAGRSSQLINAQLDVDAYDIKTGNNIGNGYGSKLNYTSLNATDQATDAVMQLKCHPSHLSEQRWCLSEA